MDATYLQRFLSDSARAATRSEIRELLKMIAHPDMISLAGGMPSPSTFPIASLVETLPRLLERHGRQALQYGTTEGDPGLRQELLRLLVADGVSDRTLDNVLVTSASQQGLDLCSRMLIAPGDAVICGLPSYLGALGAFTACGARLSGIPLDEHGMRTDLLEQRLIDLRREDVRPKFVYVVPDFQNPAGVTLSLERRCEILLIAGEFDLLVLEDSPYRQLRYVGRSVPSMQSLDRDGRVISLYTFSKILSPGLRLGWIVADAEIISKLVVIKQPVDLCTNGLSQMLAREYLAAGELPRQIELIRNEYGEKRAALLDALDRHMDPAWEVRWTRPEGGLFVWVTLPEWMDARVLQTRALQDHVAFVIGSAFHCDGSGQNTLRLNFSYPSLEQIETAIGRLARAIADLRRETPAVQPLPRSTVQPIPMRLTDGVHSLEQLSWNLAVSEVLE